MKNRLRELTVRGNRWSNPEREKRLNNYVRGWIKEGIRAIDVRREGLPFPILAPAMRLDGSWENREDVAGEVTDIFSDVLHLGGRQKISASGRLRIGAAVREAPVKMSF